MKKRKVSGDGKKDVDDLEDLLDDVLTTKDIEEVKNLSEIISTLKDLLTDKSILKDFEEYNGMNQAKVLEAEQAAKSEAGVQESFMTYRYLMETFSKDGEAEDIFENRAKMLFSWCSDDKEEEAELAYEHFSRLMEHVNKIEERRLQHISPHAQEIKNNEVVIRDIITQSQDKQELLVNLERALEILDQK